MIAHSAQKLNDLDEEACTEKTIELREKKSNINPLNEYFQNDNSNWREIVNNRIKQKTKIISKVMYYHCI